MITRHKGNVECPLNKWKVVLWKISDQHSPNVLEHHKRIPYPVTHTRVRCHSGVLKNIWVILPFAFLPFPELTIISKCVFSLKKSVPSPNATLLPIRAKTKANN